MSRGLLLQLKERTRSHHQSLEDHLQLLRSCMTLSEYQGLLESFYGFYLPFERRTAPLLDHSFPEFFPARCKAPLLEKDLVFLGTDPRSVPIARDLPPVSCLAEILGSLYVLEGATLGGQILSRHFLQKFSLSRDAGCSFFSSYGSEVGRMWQSFCELLLSWSSPANDMVIVQSAVQTFSCLQSWLQIQRCASTC